jgi:hypothetical protein
MFKVLEKFKPMLQTQIQQGIVIEKNGFYQTSVNYQNNPVSDATFLGCEHPYQSWNKNPFSCYTIQR